MANRAQFSSAGRPRGYYQTAGVTELGDFRLDLLRRHRVYPFMKEWFGKNYFPVLLFGFRSLPAAAPLRERRS